MLVLSLKVNKSILSLIQLTFRPPGGPGTLEKPGPDRVKEELRCSLRLIQGYIHFFLETERVPFAIVTVWVKVTMSC